MRFLYSALHYGLLPFILLRLLWRSRLAPEYRKRWSERFGFSPPDPHADGRPAIWVHAVSVGETIAAVPVIEALITDYPGHRVVVTTTTPTGSERVRALFGQRVFHAYCPWDLPGAVRRFRRRIRPELLLIMETELWPNLLHQCHAAGCRIVLANARLSARSARGYARFSGLTRGMLACLDRVACQARDDGDRLLALGLPPDRLEVTGSIKFDLELTPRLQRRAQELVGALGARPVLVAASTHPGEDERLLDAFARLRQSQPDCLLVLVPRHPERFDAVYSLCLDRGWPVVRRSAGRIPGADDAILLGDTMGELLLLLGTATVAFIGGSLVEHGGHNPLEASAWGAPVVSGPHTFNFTEVNRLLVEAGAMLQLAPGDDLGQCLEELLADPPRLQRMGEAGVRVVEANRGSRQRLLALVAGLLR